jgi:uncharacterized membrane protein
MRLWLIPTSYVVTSVLAAFTLPRLEHAYLGSYDHGLSISSMQAYLSAAASGMMALTAIVFSIAFVMVQFSAIVYSPRLVLLFVRDRTLFHTLGCFVATFVYSLAALAWTDRGGSGSVPLYSTLLVVMMVIVSVILFSFLVQRLNDLQISNVLHVVGDKGRQVIHTMYSRRDDKKIDMRKAKCDIAGGPHLGPATQSLTYSGRPRTIASYDIEALVRAAQKADAVIVMASAVGDTLVENALILRVHGARTMLPEHMLIKGLHLKTERTFDQDPKFAIRLLADIAIKALSPAINDPTTAVQTIDQIEDLLHHLGQSELDAGRVRDTMGNLRLIFPAPTWEDYLALAFDEIRQFGATSVQVMRRLRSALIAVAESLINPSQVEAVHQYLKHLDVVIDHSSFDPEDRIAARQEDRQGLGSARFHADTKALVNSRPMK